MSLTSISREEKLNSNLVLDYLVTHPGFLENFVIGPHISRETFQRWTLKRNNKVRQDSKRHLLPGYTTPASRANSRRILYESSLNHYQLLYGLALNCAQIVHSEHFELLVCDNYDEKKDNNGNFKLNTNHGRTTNGSETETNASTTPKSHAKNWHLVVQNSNEPGTNVKLKRLQKQKKQPLQILKLIDCNEVLIGVIHFFSVVNDRDMQYLHVLCTWACSVVYFAKLANVKQLVSKSSEATPLATNPLFNFEDTSYLNRQRKLNSFLLDVVKSIFQDMITMDTVILKVMNFAQKLVDADRASLFLVDNKANEIYARIFDISQSESESKVNARDDHTNILIDNEGNKEIRFPIGKGIAGHVALTGESLNISNAYEDERFNREIDTKTGYHTKTILCMPIFLRNTVIGVVQMVNKHDGIFTQIDEEAFETFANYCGLALHHSRLYDKIRRSEQKYRVALEVLAYHSVCNRDEVNKLKRVQIHKNIPELDLFEFNGNRLSELEKPLYAVYMFETLFNNVIDYEHDDLIRFILTVRKNYRKVPYHNWTHGWTVAHAMFVFLRRTTEIFAPLERLALFVAAICHDLDHRGKNNAYMKTMSTPLASIYSTSVMEHHHFNQTVTILQQDGHNILKSLRSNEYKEVLGLIRHCILATDLALFFPNRAALAEIIKSGTFDWKNLRHRNVLQAILMTACDLIATAKPWKVQTEIVKVIFEEFYEQGDAEKINGREPLPMMDRNKAHELPQMQVGFMRGICLPCYEVLSNLLPDAAKLQERAKYNTAKWEQLNHEYQNKQED